MWQNHSIVSLHCFIFLVSDTGVMIVNILKLNKHIEICGKYCLALHLAEMEPDPDRQALDKDLGRVK
jgi:hypothetical protein